MAEQRHCPDCGRAKDVVAVGTGSAEVESFRCGHCGQEWRERDGELEARVYAQPLRTAESEKPASSGS